MFFIFWKRAASGHSSCKPVIIVLGIVIREIVLDCCAGRRVAATAVACVPGRRAMPVVGRIIRVRCLHIIIDFADNRMIRSIYEAE